MKRRYLKKWVEIPLTLITMVMMIGLMMVDYVEIKIIPYLLLAWVIVGFNIHLLVTYGKGWAFSEEEDNG